MPFDDEMPRKPAAPRRRRGAIPHAPRRPDRKTLQLCRQVARALEGALACSPVDAVRNLLVDQVVPAPSAGRLLVTVRPLPGMRVDDPVRILGRLYEAAPDLRREVAAEITRRATPELVFQLAPPEPGTAVQR
jgi:hypothetical protein